MDNKNTKLIIMAVAAIVIIVAGFIIYKAFVVPPEKEKISNAGSGVFGTVVLGPVCPVERVPPDPNCAPTPYQTDITITKEGFSKQIKSDYEGKFRTDLNPGIYKFSAKGGNTLPRCEPVSAEVKPKTFISLSIQCDTGIR